MKAQRKRKTRCFVLVVLFVYFESVLYKKEGRSKYPSDGYFGAKPGVNCIRIQDVLTFFEPLGQTSPSGFSVQNCPHLDGTF